MTGLWLVARYLVAIAAIIILQLVPITGALLMLFLAVLWPAAVFNIMLLHVGIAAAIGRIERTWLALPLAVYAVWGAVGGIGYVQALKLQATMNAPNDNAPRLSVADRVFIFRSQDSKLENDTSVAYANVLQNARVYSRDRRYERALDTRCQRQENAEWRLDSQAPRIDRSFRLPAVSFNGACIVSRAEQPPPEGILVDLRSFAAHSMFVRLDSGKEITLSRQTANAGSQAIGQLRQGRIEYVMPFPLFLAGCSLLSAAPTWQCVWQIERKVISVGTSNSYGPYFPDMDQAHFVAERFGIAHD